MCFKKRETCEIEIQYIHFNYEKKKTGENVPDEKNFPTFKLITQICKILRLKNLHIKMYNMPAD